MGKKRALDFYGYVLVTLLATAKQVNRAILKAKQ
jgi:hypothetical protein